MSNHAHVSHTARCLSLLIVAGLLAASSARTAFEMRRDIERAVARGEWDFQQGRSGAAPDVGEDQRMMIDMRRQHSISRNGSSEPIVATATIDGAPPGYVLSRDREGCWRLPAHGHCWRANEANVRDTRGHGTDSWTAR